MINAAKAVILNEDKILLIKRSEDSHFFPGLWDLPGGKLNLNEEPMEAVVRETKEESSLQVVPEKIVAEYDHTENNRSVHFWVISIQKYSGNVTLSKDHTKYKWVPISRLSDYNLTPVVGLHFGVGS